MNELKFKLIGYTKTNAALEKVLIDIYEKNDKEMLSLDKYNSAFILLFYDFLVDNNIINQELLEEVINSRILIYNQIEEYFNREKIKALIQ
jgi:hypothetical protein